MKTPRTETLPVAATRRPHQCPLQHTVKDFLFALRCASNLPWLMFDARGRDVWKCALLLEEHVAPVKVKRDAVGGVRLLPVPLDSFTKNTPYTPRQSRTMCRARVHHALRGQSNGAFGGVVGPFVSAGLAHRHHTHFARRVFTQYPVPCSLVPCTDTQPPNHIPA